jgi:hypothetical protein
VLPQNWQRPLPVILVLALALGWLVAGGGCNSSQQKNEVPAANAALVWDEKNWDQANWQ